MNPATSSAAEGLRHAKDERRSAIMTAISNTDKALAGAANTGSVVSVREELATKRRQALAEVDRHDQRIDRLRDNIQQLMLELEQEQSQRVTAQHRADMYDAALRQGSR